MPNTCNGIFAFYVCASDVQMHFLAPSKKDIIMLAECVLSIPEFNWNQRFRDKKTTLKICRQVLASSTQRQNRSLHVGG